MIPYIVLLPPCCDENTTCTLNYFAHVCVHIYLYLCMCGVGQRARLAVIFNYSPTFLSQGLLMNGPADSFQGAGQCRSSTISDSSAGILDASCCAWPFMRAVDSKRSLCLPSEYFTNGVISPNPRSILLKFKVCNTLVLTMIIPTVI